jgi:glycosyltransferase involved in cell wall biosynthesis
MEKKKKNSKKLNIAMVCDAIAYKNGASVSTIRFAEGLRKKDHEIIFFADRSPQHPHYESEFLGFKTYRFFSLLMPKGDGLYRISFPRRRKLEKLFREHEIDIVHVFLPVPSTISAVRAAKKIGLPVIAHSHAQSENLFLHVPRPLAFIVPTLNALFERYMGWIYKNADFIIYPSEFARRPFLKLNQIKRNIVVSNGVDVQEFKPIDSEKIQAVKEKYGAPEGQALILYLGRLHPEKNIETLIKAMQAIKKSHRPSHLVIVGGGHLEPKLKNLVRKLGLEKEISFWGKIPDEDKVAAYNACDIFVLPSLAELEGMVVLEAMACGKPIVVANSPQSASTYFVGQNGFLFEPESHEDLAHQIIKILKDEEMRNKMAEASLQKSRQYDINQSIALLEETYYSVLEK